MKKDSGPWQMQGAKEALGKATKGSGVGLADNSGRKEVRKIHVQTPHTKERAWALGSLGNGSDVKDADTGSP